MEFTFNDAKVSMIDKIIKKGKDIGKVIESYNLKKRSILDEFPAMIMSQYSSGCSWLVPKSTYSDWKYIFTCLPNLLDFLCNRYSFPSTYFPIVPGNLHWDTMILLLFSIPPAVRSLSCSFLLLPSSFLDLLPFSLRPASSFLPFYLPPTTPSTSQCLFSKLFCII